MKRYVPILRPTANTPCVHGVVLGMLLEVRVHYAVDVGTFPCLAGACKFAAGGKTCNHPAAFRWFGPALVCVATSVQPSAQQVEDYDRARRLYRASGGREGAGPLAKPPLPHSAILPAEPRAEAIAEVLDTAIDIFDEPHRGIIFSRGTQGRKAVYQARGRLPDHMLPDPFNVVPFLERIFGMPVLPVEEEGQADEWPASVPFRKAGGA